ncbi:antitoxin family protein [Argonema antarcticum]|uniref:antitoxin family protein n=1 Tax=Argonema antarcticum TaxID=2942763 RepID=UPI002012CBA9|nr:antitoxin family protein [Argonema antarcticum]MCL1475473.1 antitoxin family protein [Argonema antarcticum A004/B2]
MSEIIIAVYENGVLHPINPVSLSEGQSVRLQVVPEVASEEPKNELEEALGSLVDQGKISISPKRGQIDRAELAQRQKTRKLVKIEGKPLSETIIEDRGPW